MPRAAHSVSSKARALVCEGGRTLTERRLSTSSAQRRVRGLAGGPGWITIAFVLRSCLLLVVCVALVPWPLRAQPVGVDRVARALERGDAHRKVGDTLSALAFYRDAIAIAPRRSEGYAALGALHLKLGEPLRALEVYEAGVRNAGRGEALWLGYAEVLEAVQQPARALAALRRYLELEPSSERGLRALAEAAARRGAFVEALATRRALLDLFTKANAHGERAQEVLVERAQVRALERVVGGAERVRGHTVCADPSAGGVARALAHCP